MQPDFRPSSLHLSLCQGAKVFETVVVFDDDRMVDRLGQPLGNGFHPFGKHVGIFIVADMLPPAVNNLLIAKILGLRCASQHRGPESI